MSALNPDASNGRGRFLTRAATSNGAAKAKSDRHSPKVTTSTVSPENLSVHDGRLRKLLQMMEEEPARSIRDCARTFNLSRSYLRHLFKQETGLSLGHVLTEQKLQRAAVLLASSNLSIKEIAGVVGYEHTSSFTRAFERRFGQGPRRYRCENGWA